MMSFIRIRGASQHNLKNVSLDFPREALTVFTGVSGSGKSSLAFDTISREGQRRFLESLPAYARQFLGPLEKAKVESVDGLSPTISIDQKTVHRSPRSTVGTITDLSDYLRLLLARLGTAHCPTCGKAVATQTVDRICDRVAALYAGRRLLLCAPLVRARKGSYRRLLEDQVRNGFRRMRIDGEILRLAEDAIPELGRNEVHDISIVYDRLEIQSQTTGRLVESIEKCLALSGGLLEVIEHEPSAGEPAEAMLFYKGFFLCLLGIRAQVSDDGRWNQPFEMLRDGDNFFTWTHSGIAEHLAGQMRARPVGCHCENTKIWPY